MSLFGQSKPDQPRDKQVVGLWKVYKDINAQLAQIGRRAELGPLSSGDENTLRKLVRRRSEVEKLMKQRGLL